MVKHLIAVENARAIVDTSAPDVPKAHYHNIFAQNLSNLFQCKIDRANARLLANLASIYSGHWKVRKKCFKLKYTTNFDTFSST